jgi:hypothetical protein
MQLLIDKTLVNIANIKTLSVMEDGNGEGIYADGVCISTDPVVAEALLEVLDAFDVLNIWEDKKKLMAQREAREQAGADENPFPLAMMMPSTEKN